MRFKDYILCEDFGLGDIGAKMDKMFNNPHFQNQASAFVSTGHTNPGPQGSTFAPDPLQAPITHVEIPQIEKTGRVKILETKKNPIYLELSDGTKAYFTYDEFQRIQGVPSIGKVMTIIFQRHPNDKTNQYSKIEKAIVLDG